MSILGVKLEFFRADTLEPLTIGDFGNLYKNTSNNVLPVLIANTGDRDAVNVTAKFTGYKRNDGRTEDISDDWKSLSYDSTSVIFKKELELPDIRAGQFMTGFKVFSDNFNNYIVKDLGATGRWKTNGDKWEVYTLTEDNKLNSYVHHKVETLEINKINTARAIPTGFPITKNCVTSVELAVSRNNFGGLQFRLDDDDYGYWVIIYPDPNTIRKINEYYSQYIPDYKPIDLTREGAIGIGKGHYTELNDFSKYNVYKQCDYWFPKGTGILRLERDVLRVELRENVFQIYINDNYIGKWIDKNPIMTSGRMALLAGRQYNSVVIFDNLEHRIETERGVLYCRSDVPASPELSLDGDNIYYSSLLIEYSE